MDAQDIAKIEAAQPAYEDETDPAVRDGWQIDSLGSLEWAMSRIADLEAEGQELAQATETAVEKIRDRSKALAAKVERGVAFFRSRVLAYAETHRNELLKGGKRKSRALIYGVVGWRASGGRLRITDKDALTAWASAHPLEAGLYRLKVEPEVKAIQAFAKEHHVVPPGTEWEDEHDTPYVDAISPGTSLAKHGE